MCCYCFHIDPAIAAASQANKEEVDARSVFVGNVSTRMLKSLILSKLFALCALSLNMSSPNGHVALLSAFFMYVDSQLIILTLGRNPPVCHVIFV